MQVDIAPIGSAAATADVVQLIDNGEATTLAIEIAPPAAESPLPRTPQI